MEYPSITVTTRLNRTLMTTFFLVAVLKLNHSQQKRIGKKVPLDPIKPDLPIQNVGEAKFVNLKEQILHLLKLGFSPRFIISFFKTFYLFFICALCYVAMTEWFPRKDSNKIYHTGSVVIMILLILLDIFLLFT